ncbi:MAG: CinA family protein [Fretibacterium sp.]|nr:CinA family protein [Fretibacterium sp.]
MSLAEEVFEAARTAGLTLCCAESCTAGMVGSALTEMPGSSEVFRGGVIVYCNEMKHQLLGVPQPVLDGPGPVSRECALALAEGVLQLIGADAAVSVTGLAGPDGGTEAIPVGTVWFGVALRGESVRSGAFVRHFSGSRSEIRHQAADSALEGLLRAIRDGDVSGGE